MKEPTAPPRRVSETVQSATDEQDHKPISAEAMRSILSQVDDMVRKGQIIPEKPAE